MANTKNKTTRRKKSRAHRADLYQEVTDKIIKELEAGSVPWVQPWDSGSEAALVGVPTNASTNATYSGINIMLLWIGGFAGGFTSTKWLTYNQAKSLGATVRKGEKGTTVCYASNFIPKGAKEKAIQTGNDPEAIPFRKRYTVFNIEQIDGLEPDITAAPKPVDPDSIIPRAEKLIRATGANFNIGGSKAFYMPSMDAIQVPPMSAYNDQINWYRTALHELTHWTSHKTRCDRDLSQYHKDKGARCREEMIAEIGASFLCAGLDIIPTVRHSDYIASWLTVLKNDKRAVFKAASLATKAADYILDFEKEF